MHFCICGVGGWGFSFSYECYVVCAAIGPVSLFDGKLTGPVSLFVGKLIGPVSLFDEKLIEPVSLFDGKLTGPDCYSLNFTL